MFEEFKPAVPVTIRTKPTKPVDDPLVIEIKRKQGEDIPKPISLFIHNKLNIMRSPFPSVFVEWPHFVLVWCTSGRKSKDFHGICNADCIPWKAARYVWVFHE